MDIEYYDAVNGCIKELFLLAMHDITTAPNMSDIHSHYPMGGIHGLPFLTYNKAETGARPWMALYKSVDALAPILHPYLRKGDPPSPSAPSSEPSAQKQKPTKAPSHSSAPPAIYNHTTQLFLFASCSF